MPMLLNSFSAKRAKKCSNIYGAEVFYRNYNASRQHALDGSFLKGTCLGYVDILASEHGGFNQHSIVNVGSDIDFGVSRSISRFI